MSGKHHCWSLLLLNCLWGIILCSAQNLCFQCSDPNIEVGFNNGILKFPQIILIESTIHARQGYNESATRNMSTGDECTNVTDLQHYGAFFNNPRVLQDDSRGDERQPPCESGRNVRFQMCRDPCYTLNVTTFDIRSKQHLLFGMSHGCSTLVLLSSRIRSNSCFHSSILLQTTPPHPLQTQYCFCTGDTCNLIRSASTMMRIGASRLKEQDSALITRSHTGITNITSGSTAKNMHISATFLLLFVLLRCYLYVPIFLFASHRNLSGENNLRSELFVS